MMVVKMIKRETNEIDNILFSLYLRACADFRGMDPAAAESPFYLVR